MVSVPPPPLVPGEGAHSLARERVGESQFRRGILCICTLWESFSSAIFEEKFLLAWIKHPFCAVIFTVYEVMSYLYFLVLGMGG
jgi:hypothetical protein